MAKITLIACIQQDNGIGYEGDLIWRIPLDMAVFKHYTKGHVCVMGRNTFNSLPEPLKGRTNVVLSRDKIDIEGVTTYHDLEDLNKFLDTLDEEVFIIGGARMYEAYLNKADKVILTRVGDTKPADTFFPKFDFVGKYEVQSVAQWDIDVHAETLVYTKK
ncbi:MAG: dihydrofolate reductase [Acetobacter sp.]|nr:dihydrofolate reductase [Acetobacter sp.]